MALIGFLAVVAVLALAALSLAWRLHMMFTDPQRYRDVRAAEAAYKAARNEAIGKIAKNAVDKTKDLFGKGGGAA